MAISSGVWEAVLDWAASEILNVSFSQHGHTTVTDETEKYTWSGMKGHLSHLGNNHFKLENFNARRWKEGGNGEKRTYDVIVNTAPPDVVMNYVYGELPFIGRKFHKFVLPVQFAFPENVYF